MAGSTDRAERLLLQGPDPTRRRVRAPAEKPSPSGGGLIQTGRGEPEELPGGSRKTGRAKRVKADRGMVAAAGSGSFCGESVRVGRRTKTGTAEGKLNHVPGFHRF